MSKDQDEIISSLVKEALEEMSNKSTWRDIARDSEVDKRLLVATGEFMKLLEYIEGEHLTEGKRFDEVASRMMMSFIVIALVRCALKIKIQQGGDEEDEKGAFYSLRDSTIMRIMGVKYGLALDFVSEILTDARAAPKPETD